MREREREKDQFRIYCINDNTFSPTQQLCDGKDLFWGLQLEEAAFAFAFWLGVWGWAVLGINLQRFSSSLCSVHSVKSVRNSLSCDSGMQTLSVISFQCATVRKSFPFIVPCCGLSATSIDCLERETASYVQSWTACNRQQVAGIVIWLQKESLVIQTSLGRVLYIPCL